jgi:two-component sensor histidine kinase
MKILGLIIFLITIGVMGIYKQNQHEKRAINHIEVMIDTMKINTAEMIKSTEASQEILHMMNNDVDKLKISHDKLYNDRLNMMKNWNGIPF